jgi:hypothetical protein
MNIISNLDIKGHLTISKVKNNFEEVVFDDKNIIVSGMGVGLSYLFSKLGSDSIIDFQINRFQLGVSGSVGSQVSSTFKLVEPLSSSEYTGGNPYSNLDVTSSYQFQNNSVVSSVPFIVIPHTKITRIDERSVRYTMFIDEDSCNNLTRNGNPAYLNEIGLFMKNPMSYSLGDASILVAYKHFSNIRKTPDFAYIFRWTITFG